ncbi:hypothetical protein [Pseudomonas umsongensis]|uniref:hypothetical protein n=1 Tax=Pseudomonas umsongensis TaxID=198618 RepID=UPI0003756FF2|nr:hypothetical protein [Pseudomonas umsongensis]
MTKAETPLYSPIENLTHRNERIGNTSIGEAIARNHGLLLEHFFEPLFDRDVYIKLLNDISAVTNNLARQAELEQAWDSEVNEYDNDTKSALKEAQYACLYIELARAAEASKEHVRAWAFNNHASLMVGEIIEKSAAVQQRAESKKRSQQNSKNGKARIKNFLPVKEEAIRLLEELKPEGGWISYSGAASKLEDDLVKFILKTRPSGLTSSNIRELLEKTWLPGDELVNPAWKKNKHADAP